jgi:ribonuclease P protein component
LFTFKKDLIIISKTTLAHFRRLPCISSKHIKLSYQTYSSNILGIRIAKKSVPLAVSRNSLRRVLRETFRGFRFTNDSYAVLLTITSKIQAEKKDINDILLPEWKSLLDQLR